MSACVRIKLWEVQLYYQTGKRAFHQHIQHSVSIVMDILMKHALSGKSPLGALTRGPQTCKRILFQQPSDQVPCVLWRSFVFTRPFYNTFDEKNQSTQFTFKVENRTYVMLYQPCLLHEQ